MLNNRFAVLTGHLNDYPLSDLIGVLRHQRKTGRLLIEYAKGPAMFYFNDGDLVDAQLGDLVGLQAICVAVGQPPAPFNFNSLIRPSRRSIENSLQRVISELLGCWDENDLQIVSVATETARSLPSSPSAENVTQSEDLRPLALSGLVAQKPARNYSRTMVASVAAALMLLGLSTGIAVTSGFGSRAASASKSSSTAEGKTEQSGESTRPEMTSKAARTVSKTENAVGREMRNSRDAGAGPALHQKAIGHSQAKNTANVADVSSGASAASAVDAPNGEDPASENSSPTRSIKVVMQIENGRVLRASVSKSQAGMESYEAMALRIARQRRYPAQTDGQETVTIRIAQP